MINLHDNTVDALEQRISDLEGVLESLRTWVEFYPLKVFPEPDLKLAAKALNGVGITLDAVSASAMRHVLTQVTEMIDKAQITHKTLQAKLSNGEDIIDKLLDLQRQATVERSHYYAASCITEAIQEILTLRMKVK